MKLYSWIATSLTFLFAPFFTDCQGGKNKEKIELDLKSGTISGHSNFITVLSSPIPSSTRTRCDGQAVVKINFSGPFQKARFVLEYDEDPREWTLDISDSSTGDGFGGDGDHTAYMAETQILNRQMRIYSNNLPGHTQETINGGLLMKVVDDIVDVNSRLAIEISDERVKWNNNVDVRGSISSRYLYALENQSPLYGLPDYNIYAGFNRVPSGNYRSGSGLCRATVIVTNKADQGEVDECNDGTHTCEENAVCTQTRRSFRCSCKNGFSRQGTSCIDVDECEVKNGGCVHTCTNSPGSYTCGCKAGFVLSPEGRDCVDLDECETGAHDCEYECVNTIGSYECRCPKGKFLDEQGTRCSRDAGCGNSNLGCSHYCVDISMDESICECRVGFMLSGNKRQCIPTCSHGNGGCQHICTDYPMGPLCSCHEKYNLHTDGKTCVETCGLNNGGCDRVCKDTPTGVQCSCPEGYELQADGRTCRDINECLENNGGCDNHCSNKIGGFECSCPPGYKLLTDGRSCIDVDECAINGTCDHTCVNYPGGFTCQCDPGYQLYGITHCGDVDECSINNGGCQYGCVNLPGSYQCFCDRGYRLHPNRKDCMETSRCLPLRTPALAVLECDKENSVETCSLQCESNSHFSTSEGGTYTYRCGQSTQYKWTPEMRNDTLPSCSEAVNAPVLHRRASFTFTADRCRLRKKSQSRISENFRETLSKRITAINGEGCSDLCQVSFVNLSCDNRDLSQREKRKRRERQRNKRSGSGSVITADFEIEIRSETPTDNCDVNCVKRNTEKQLRRTINKLRRSINKEQFVVRFLGKEYEVIRNSLTTSDVETSCPLGHTLMVDDRCVACSVGTYHDTDTNICQQCPAGTFQDQEGQMECSKCPQGDGNYGIPGARDITECGGQCRPGEYSMDGFQPCDQCPIGTYQPEPGHTHCLSCGGGLQTRSTGSTSFGNCLTRELCLRGHFYNIKTHQCEPCKKGAYQSSPYMNYCIRCPGNTTTDSDGAYDSEQCKDQTCRGVIGDDMGYIESPNWPGEYPANSECIWQISPPKGRRVIVVVSQIFLPKEDGCGDSLVMRRSPSPYSVTTFETCENVTRPIAFVAQTKKLWIQFQSNGANSHTGFQIHYATYDENYEYLIKDIVADGRLYESNHHQEILKDKAVLKALLEVISKPEMYYTYDTPESLLPQSFIKLLRNKVQRFFYPDP